MAAESVGDGGSGSLGETVWAEVVIEVLGPDRVAAAVEAFRYSGGLFRCPVCRRLGDGATEPTSAIAYVCRRDVARYDDVEVWADLSFPIDRWAVLRAHRGCSLAGEEVRQWVHPRLMPWEPGDLVSAVTASGDDEPAYKTWFSTFTTPGGELPAFVVQPHLAETVFVSSAEHPEGEMHDPRHMSLVRRGAGRGVWLGCLSGQGPPGASVARRLKGWSFEMHENRRVVLVHAPVQRPTFGFPSPSSEPFLGGDGGGPVPITWHDALRRAGEVLFVMLPTGTLALDTPDAAVLSDPRLEWLAALQGGLHGGLVEVV